MIKRPASCRCRLNLGLCSLLVIGAFVPGTASAQRPVVDATYGVPVNYDGRILRYPDFTAQLEQKTEWMRTDSDVPWVMHQFLVLDNERRTIGGSINFNSETLANGRRFDVNGRIYVAEKFFTTAFRPGTGSDDVQRSAMAADEIVVWDQASAVAGNPAIAAIWERETIDPAAQWSSTNAYSDGVLLPGFSNESAVNRGRSADDLSIRNIALVERNSPPDDSTVIPSTYGTPFRFDEGVLEYPDFRVLFFKRTERTRPRNSVFYDFLIIDRNGAIGRWGLGFQTLPNANGRAFSLGGRTYFAEMFATTAGRPAGPAEPLAIPQPLADNEIVIWDQASAAVGNLPLLPILQQTRPESEGNRVYAGAVPTEGLFTGSTIIGSAGEFRTMDELDRAPSAIDITPWNYPQEFRGTGYTGRVGGFLIINPDGSVRSGGVTHGTERRFRDPVTQALAQWRFTPPTVDGRPVTAMIQFTADISERGPIELLLDPP